MRIIARRTLRAFWERAGCRDAEQPLRAWFAEVEKAAWRTPRDVKALYRSASVLPGGCVVFNIAGNKYRLVTAIRYDLGIVFIRFIGTHESYDRINVKEI